MWSEYQPDLSRRVRHTSQSELNAVTLELSLVATHNTRQRTPTRMIPIRSESSARSSAPKPRPSRPLVDRSSRSLTNTRSDLPSIQTSCSHHRCSPTPIQATAPSMKPNQTGDRSSSRSDGRPVADLTRNWRSTWTAPRQQPKQPCVETVTSRHSDVPNVTNGSQAPRRPTSCRRSRIGRHGPSCVIMRHSADRTAQKQRRITTSKRRQGNAPIRRIGRATNRRSVTAS